MFSTVFVEVLMTDMLSELELATNSVVLPGATYSAVGSRPTLIS